MADDGIDALHKDADVRRRAREICKIIARARCADGDSPKSCDGETCYIWELIEMGCRGRPK